MRTVTLPTVLNGAVAMECDVLDARPKPEIRWFADTNPRPIVEVKKQNQILYLDDGRYLYIRTLTPMQRMMSYHCEIRNAFLSPTSVRAPTTYVLDGNILSFTLAEYRSADELNYAILGEPVTYVYAAAQAGEDGITATSLIVSCTRNLPPGTMVSVSTDVVLTIEGLSGDAITGLESLHCTIIGRNIQSQLELTFLVSRKRSKF